MSVGCLLDAKAYDVPEASSTVVAELPGLGSHLSCADRSRCLGKSLLEHPKSRHQWQQTTGGMAAFKMAWKQPHHCYIPITWLFFNRVTLGSFNFYLNTCFPDEILESAALAPWTSAEPLEIELSVRSAETLLRKLPPELSPGSFLAADPVLALFPHPFPSQQGRYDL